MTIRSLLCIGALFFSVACNSTVVGQSCGADSECGEFKCLHDKIGGSGGCSDFPGPGSCGPACSTHAECKKYGETFKCALSTLGATCNPTGRCLDDYRCTGSGCREAPEN